MSGNKHVQAGPERKGKAAARRAAAEASDTVAQAEAFLRAPGVPAPQRRAYDPDSHEAPLRPRSRAHLAPAPREEAPTVELVPGYHARRKHRRRAAKRRAAAARPAAGQASVSNEDSPDAQAGPVVPPLGQESRPSSRTEPPGDEEEVLPEDHELPPSTTLPVAPQRRHAEGTAVHKQRSADRRTSSVAEQPTSVAARGAAPQERRGGGGARVKGRRRSATSVVDTVPPGIAAVSEAADVELGHLAQHNAAVNLARLATMQAQMESVVVQKERRSTTQRAASHQLPCYLGHVEVCRRDIYMLK